MSENLENQEQKKKVILSGIQPTGKIHIGNLFGAIKNWVAMQDEFECYYMVVDLHSITIRQTPAELRANTLNMAAILLACGLEPERCTLFIQSQVPEHAQLAWILNCYAQMGEMNRMTQFKDKSLKHPDNINLGLFAYPVLMASDILLYQSDLVPVGEDQRQHLELTRNVAERFNYYHENTFKIPEPYIPPIGAKIMSLQEPTKKMSKSDENEKSCIFLTDSDAEIRNKIKRAVTDSGSEITFTSDKPGIQNLMTLYNLATGKSYKEIEAEFAGKGYGDFKAETAEVMANYLNPLREKYESIKNNKKYLQEVLTEGAKKANSVAFKTLRKVYKKVGLVQF